LNEYDGTGVDDLNRLLLLLLMLLVVLSPLPLGSNRSWSWSLAAMVSAILALGWVLTRIRRMKEVSTLIHPLIPGLFAFTCIWVLIQAAQWIPQGWQHPLWLQASAVLGIELPGSISVAAEQGWTALMRLLSYAMIFFLTFQLARERSRAYAVFNWIILAGLAYGVFGLISFWGEFSPALLFQDRQLPHDLRSTFINRNHFATWMGLTVLCAMALFYQKMSRPVVRPYEMPRDQESSFEQFVLKAWLPLTSLLLMVTAIVLTHSRGGFTASLAGSIVLLWLLDSRASSKNTLSRITVVAALVVASFAFYLTSEVLLERIDRTDITAEQRMAVFAQVNKGIGDNPVLGFGYGTFADSFRLYDQVEEPVHYDRAHNTWLENIFELGFPAAMALFLALGGLVLTCLRGVRRRHRDWVFPATGVAASVLVAIHALVDFSLQIPAVAIIYACIMGVACAQSHSSHNR
jgi:O-antigen ligase